MIESFKCKETKKIFARQFSKKLPINIQHIAFRKLRMLNQSSTVQDLTVPPCVLKVDQEVYKIPWDAGVKWEE